MGADLDDTSSITKVNEKQVPVRPLVMNPPGKNHFLALQLTPILKNRPNQDSAFEFVKHVASSL
jgi:hypothetical protein